MAFEQENCHNVERISWPSSWGELALFCSQAEKQGQGERQGERQGWEQGGQGQAQKTGRGGTFWFSLFPSRSFSRSLSFSFPLSFCKDHHEPARLLFCDIIGLNCELLADRSRAMPWTGKLMYVAQFAWRTCETV